MYIIPGIDELLLIYIYHKKKYYYIYMYIYNLSKLQQETFATNRCNDYCNIRYYLILPL